MADKSGQIVSKENFTIVEPEQSARPASSSGLENSRPLRRGIPLTSYFRLGGGEGDGDGLGAGAGVGVR